MPEERPVVAKGETVCPACGGKLLPIVYGLPSPKGMAAAESGEVVLGGCVLMGDDPRMACVACGIRYWIDRNAGPRRS